MKNIFRVLLLLLLTGCGDSFSGMEEKIIESAGPSGPIGPEGGYTVTMVPIRPTFNDATYDIIAPTRGAGAFQNWEVDKSRWLNTDFTIYSFLNNNHFYNGVVDFTPRPYDGNESAAIPQNCLINGVTARINDAAELRFHEDGQEKTLYYSKRFPNLRYDFFAYYADDAARGAVSWNGTNLTLPIEIDGSQDVMQGYAYHTEKEQNEFLGKINASTDESKVLSQYKGELFYSTITAHRAIHPQIRMHHLLSCVNVFVLGRTAVGKEDIEDYKNVYITGISLESKYKGNMVIASPYWKNVGESTNTYEVDFEAGKLVNFEDEKVSLHVKNIKTNHEEEKLQGAFQVKSREPQQVADSILLAPAESYMLHLTYKYKGTDVNGNEQIQEGYLDYEVKFAEEGKKFLPGRFYSVYVYVYGPQSIEVNTLLIPGWENDGNIEVGKDPEDNTESGI